MMNLDDSNARKVAVFCFFNVPFAVAQTFSLVVKTIPSIKLEEIEEMYREFEIKKRQEVEDVDESPVRQLDIQTGVEVKYECDVVEPVSKKRKMIAEEEIKREVEEEDGTSSIEKTYQWIPPQVYHNEDIKKLQIYLDHDGVKFGKVLANEAYPQDRKTSEDLEGVPFKLLVRKQLQDLVEILKEPKLKLEKLTINCNKSQSDEMNEKKKIFIEEMMSVFRQLERQLFVKELGIAADNEITAKTILEKIQKDSLEKLDLNSIVNQEEKLFTLDKIMNLSEWKNLRSFRCSSATLDCDIMQLSKIEVLVVTLKEFDLDKLDNYKKRLAETPTSKFHWFFMVGISDPSSYFREVLRHFEPNFRTDISDERKVSHISNMGLFKIDFDGEILAFHFEEKKDVETNCSC
uniref:FTH domain-containing protein n=1 Tax=Caenorhabditis tropicalis TaxID=1561998 RepID=A0A1I7T3G8_9PELO